MKVVTHSGRCTILILITEKYKNVTEKYQKFHREIPEKFIEKYKKNH